MRAARTSILLLYLFLLAIIAEESAWAFQVPNKKDQGRSTRMLPVAHNPHRERTMLKMAATNDNENGNKRVTTSSKKKKTFTIGDLKKQLSQNPENFLVFGETKKKKKKRYKRTRKRVEQPKQQYLYQSQRRKNDEVDQGANRGPLVLAQEFGLVPSTQHCDALVDDNVDPQILGQIRVREGNGSDSHAYLIYKPAGWSVVGGKGLKKQVVKQLAVDDTQEEDARSESKSKFTRRVKSVDDEEGSVETIEYNELDLVELLTPKELQDYMEELSPEEKDAIKAHLENKKAPVPDKEAPYSTEKKITHSQNHRSESKSKYTVKAMDDDDGSVEMIEYNELDLVELLTPEELQEYMEELSPEEKNATKARLENKKAPVPDKDDDAPKLRDKSKCTVDDDDGSVETVEYNELDLVELLTPEELQEYVEELSPEEKNAIKAHLENKKAPVPEKKDPYSTEKITPSPITDDVDDDDTPKLRDKSKYSRPVKAVDDDDGSVETVEYNELDLVELLTPEELKEYMEDLSPEEKKAIKARLENKKLPVPDKEAPYSTEKITPSPTTGDDDDAPKLRDKSKCTRRVRGVDDDDESVETIEYNELDLVELLTPEELQEYMEELSPEEKKAITARLENKKAAVPEKDNDAPKLRDKSNYTVNDDDGSAETIEYNELDLVELLTPEELQEYIEELSPEEKNAIKARLENKKASAPGKEAPSTEKKITPSQHHDDAPTRAANLRRIAARTSSSKWASFCPVQRSSVVAWLKEKKAQDGIPMKGGNFWTGLAGATNVDDSGVLLLCPKSQTTNVFVDLAEYLAVVGNGGFLAPTKSKTKNEENQIQVLRQLRRKRVGDEVQTVRVCIPEVTSTGTGVVDICQHKFGNGIRGDPKANPFDRRAQRRLVHCETMSVSSLTFDESVQVEAPVLPDDMSIWSEARGGKLFSRGSFFGRQGLRNNTQTNAYREINGVADGFPGWTVDRYDKWLFVQHDPETPQGPLPSIHDGNTLGVYLLGTKADRSEMNTVRPILLEGKEAPELLPIVENGVTYLVSLGKGLSTGLFLDQRPQRAWLTRNCGPDTRVLNCFAHTGAFSVAAASAGASTVSIDLSQKWLKRLPQQLEANGLVFDDRHDCIYGDCFDWLSRLTKRGEKYDLVILDPPSASVGGKKKKRWSVKNDMDELVEIAAKLVKKDGLLWTTTNSASIPPVKFARLCRKGLENANLKNAKLERIQPMPSDFPTVGPQPVTNLVWRIP